MKGFYGVENKKTFCLAFLCSVREIFTAKRLFQPIKQSTAIDYSDCCKIASCLAMTTFLDFSTPLRSS